MVRTRVVKTISDPSENARDTIENEPKSTSKEPSTKPQTARRSLRIQNMPKPPAPDSDIEFLEIIPAEKSKTRKTRKRPPPREDSNPETPKRSKVQEVKVEPGSEVPDEFKCFNFNCFIQIFELKKPAIDQLSNFDVIIEMFKFLTRTDVDKCQFVCKKWNEEIRKRFEDLALRPIEIAVRPGLETCNFMVKERSGLWLAAYGCLIQDTKNSAKELNKENIVSLLRMGHIVRLKMKPHSNYWKLFKGLIQKKKGKLFLERVQNVAFSCSNIQQLKTIPLWFKKQVKIDELTITIPFNFYQDALSDLCFLEKLEFSKIKVVINTYVVCQEDVITKCVHDALDSLACDEKSRDIEINQINWKVSGEDRFL